MEATDSQVTKGPSLQVNASYGTSLVLCGDCGAVNQMRVKRPKLKSVGRSQPGTVTLQKICRVPLRANERLQCTRTAFCFLQVGNAVNSPPTPRQAKDTHSFPRSMHFRGSWSAGFNLHNPSGVSGTSNLSPT